MYGKPNFIIIHSERSFWICYLKTKLACYKLCTDLLDDRVIMEMSLWYMADHKSKLKWADTQHYLKGTVQCWDDYFTKSFYNFFLMFLFWLQHEISSLGTASSRAPREASDQISSVLLQPHLLLQEVSSTEPIAKTKTVSIYQLNNIAINSF